MHAELVERWLRLMRRSTDPAKGSDMGNIGTERREVEFEPFEDQPVTRPAQPTPPAPAPVPATP